MARALMRAPAAKARMQLRTRFDGGRYKPSAAPTIFELVAIIPSSETAKIPPTPVIDKVKPRIRAELPRRESGAIFDFVPHLHKTRLDV
jgi:hypothetical protein